MRDKILEALFKSVSDETKHVDIDIATDKILALFNASVSLPSDEDLMAEVVGVTTDKDETEWWVAGAKFMRDASGGDVIKGTMYSAINTLDELDEEYRTEVFGHYCTYCGDKDPDCQCWNDE